MQSYTANLYY